MMGNYQVRFGGGRMEKGAAGFPSLPSHYGLTNPGISRELASRPPTCFAVPRAVVGAMTEAALRKSSGSSFS